MSLFPEAQVRRRQPEQFNIEHSVFLCDQRSLSFTTEAVSSPYLLFTSLSQDLAPFTTRQSSTPAGQAGAAGGASRETLRRGLIAMRWRSEARFYHTYCILLSYFLQFDGRGSQYLHICLPLALALPVRVLRVAPASAAACTTSTRSDSAFWQLPLSSFLSPYTQLSCTIESSDTTYSSIAESIRLRAQ